MSSILQATKRRNHVGFSGSAGSVSFVLTALRLRHYTGSKLRRPVRSGPLRLGGKLAIQSRQDTKAKALLLRAFVVNSAPRISAFLRLSDLTCWLLPTSILRWLNTADLRAGLLRGIPDVFPAGVNVAGSSTRLDPGQTIGKGRGFVELRVDNKLAGVV